MRTMFLVAAALPGVSMGVAYAGEIGNTQAGTFSDERPGVMARATVRNVPSVATARNGQAVQAYVTNSSRGTWLNQGGSHEGAKS